VPSGICLYNSSPMVAYIRASPKNSSRSFSLREAGVPARILSQVAFDSGGRAPLKDGFSMARKTAV
jgi:hypothetical protein